MRVGWKVVSSGFHELNATLVHSHARNVPPGHPKRLEHFCSIVQTGQVLWWETTREHHKVCPPPFCTRDEKQDAQKPAFDMFDTAVSTQGRFVCVSVHAVLNSRSIVALGVQ